MSESHPEPKISLPRDFRIEVKIGATSREDLISLLGKLVEFVGGQSEDFRKVTGSMAPTRSNLTVIHAPTETLVDSVVLDEPVWEPTDD